MVAILTDANFETAVLRSEIPVLVDFWGEGCPPCRQMAPIIETLAEEWAGRVKVGKLDVNANSATAMRYHVRGVPTLLMFETGVVVAQRVGAVGRSEIAKMVEGWG